jgi:hypothetical protein
LTPGSGQDAGPISHAPDTTRSGDRLVSYLALLDRALAPSGLFGLNCFAAGEMGSELSDAFPAHPTTSSPSARRASSMLSTLTATVTSPPQIDVGR